eukprot:13912748-Alexandrium_andersonii.AAC.1
MQSADTADRLDACWEARREAMLDEWSEAWHGAAQKHHKWAQIYCLLHYLLAAFAVVWPVLAPQAELETHPAGLVTATA